MQKIVLAIMLMFVAGNGYAADEKAANYGNFLFIESKDAITDQVRYGIEAKDKNSNGILEVSCVDNKILFGYMFSDVIRLKPQDIVYRRSIGLSRVDSFHARAGIYFIGRNFKTVLLDQSFAGSMQDPRLALSGLVGHNTLIFRLEAENNLQDLEFDLKGIDAAAHALFEKCPWPKSVYGPVAPPDKPKAKSNKKPGRPMPLGFKANGELDPIH